MVDVLNSEGVISRLPVVHPDPAKQALVHGLTQHYPGETNVGNTNLDRESATVIATESGDALMKVAHDPETLRLLAQIGFGSLLFVPLLVRARVRGALTFVSREGDPPFGPEEIALAVDLAARCAMALDNARLYREADELRLAAESANRAKSTFLGNMSHELRTPLNAIGGYAELMSMGIQGPLTEAQRSGVVRIIVNQKHLLTLINQILDFVRVEAGYATYHNDEVPLVAALGEVAGMLTSAIAEKGLVVEGPSGDPEIAAWADPDRVRQIIINVMMNAVKYSTKGVGVITLTCSSAGNTAIAEIADNGPGIPAATLEAIFEPFVQLSSGLANREGGVGLGLAISRDLARAMHGDLVAKSTVGLGSSFILTLPMLAA